jgi:hypothetical protein
MSIEITPSEASYFNLTRHHLIERLPRGKALEAVGDILGLNAQGALNYQISLWNRVEGLDPSFLPGALQEDRSLVRSWFMRDTVHIVPTADLPVFRRGLEEGLMREWNRWTVRTGRKESPESWVPLYPRVLKALDGEALTMNQIVEKVGWEGEDAKPNLVRLVREMSLRGLICNAAPIGPWYHNSEHRFTRVDQWIPGVDLNAVSPADSIAELAMRYIRAYGPASVADFSYWTGARVTDTKPVFEGLSEHLTEVSLEGQRGSYYISSEDESALEAIQPEPFARLLPQFDALIMGHKDKSRFIDTADRGDIFLPRGGIAATVLVNGRVKGTWKINKVRKGWELSLQPSQVLSSEEVEMIEGEIEQMREFTGFEILVKC